MTAVRLDDVARAMGAVLIDAAVRGAACALLVGLALAIARVRRAASRLAAWTAVLAVSFAMPMAGFLPGWHLAVPAVVARDVQLAPPAGTAAISNRNSWRGSATRGVASTGPAIPASDRRSGLAAAVATESTWRPSVVMVGCFIYFALALTCLMRTVVGWRLTRRVVRSARLVRDAAVHAALMRVGHMRRGPLPDVLESDRVFVPMTAGTVRPVLLVPADWRSWPDHRLEAVLAHELAHVARRDVLRLGLARLYRNLFWFTPVSWWLDRRIAALVEDASDDEVLRAGAEPATYAETLLAFASSVRPAGRRAAWHVGVVRSIAATERRVDRILAWTNPRASMSRARVVAAVMFALVPAVLVASARPALTRSAGRTDVVVVSAGASASVSQQAAVTPVVTFTGARGQRDASDASVRSVASTPTTPAPVAASPASDDVQSTSSSAPAQSNADPSATAQSVGRNGLSLTGTRVWVLLLDLTAASDDELQRVTTAAMKWASERMTPTDLVAVATVGSTLQIVQDLTSDAGRVGASLQAIGTTHSSRPAASPLDAFGKDVRLRAIKTICDNLSDIDVGKALLYFGHGMTRSESDDQTELRAMETSCMRANVQIDTVDTRGLAAVQIAASLRPVVAPSAVLASSLIPNAPLTVIAVHAIISAPAGGAAAPSAVVTLRNDTQKTVRAVQLGTLSTFEGMRSLPFIRGPETTVEIPPGTSRDVECRLIGAASSAESSAHPADSVGILHVDFTDGWSWDYQAKGGGGPHR